MNTKQREALLGTLKARFEKSMSRHKGVDCSAASPAGRSSICYDHVFVHHNGAQSYDFIREGEPCTENVETRAVRSS